MGLLNQFPTNGHNLLVLRWGKQSSERLRSLHKVIQLEFKSIKLNPGLELSITTLSHLPTSPSPAGKGLGLGGHSYSIFNSKDITLPTKVCIVKVIFFLGVMYGCERWTIKKTGCRRVDAFGLWCWRTLESPLDSKEIKPVNSKGNRPWIFIVNSDAKAESPILQPPNAMSRFIGKDPNAAKYWRQKEKRWQRMR